MAGSATSLLAGVGDHRKGLRLLAMGAQTERPAGAGQVGEWIVLKRDDFSSNRHLDLTYAWSMIFSENRYPLFGIMLLAVAPRRRSRRAAVDQNPTPNGPLGLKAFPKAALPRSPPPIPRPSGPLSPAMPAGPPNTRPAPVRPRLSACCQLNGVVVVLVLSVAALNTGLNGLTAAR